MLKWSLLMIIHIVNLIKLLLTELTIFFCSGLIVGRAIPSNKASSLSLSYPIEFKRICWFIH